MSATCLGAKKIRGALVGIVILCDHANWSKVDEWVA